MYGHVKGREGRLSPFTSDTEKGQFILQRSAWQQQWRRQTLPKLQTALNAMSLTELECSMQEMPAPDVRHLFPCAQGTVLASIHRNCLSFMEALTGREETAWKKTTCEYCERTFACHYSLDLFQTSISSTSKSATLGITNLGCRYSQQNKQEC